MQQLKLQDGGSAQQKFIPVTPPVPGTQHLLGLTAVLQLPDWHCEGLEQRVKSGAKEAAAAETGATTDEIMEHHQRTQAYFSNNLPTR